MPITSTHSFYCRRLSLEAKASDLGSDLGASLTLSTSDDYTSRITIFMDEVAYASQLAEAINVVGRKFFLEEEAA
jgi:hypothetical protein